MTCYLDREIANILERSTAISGKYIYCFILVRAPLMILLFFLSVQGYLEQFVEVKRQETSQQGTDWRWEGEGEEVKGWSGREAQADGSDAAGAQHIEGSDWTSSALAWSSLANVWRRSSPAKRWWLVRCCRWSKWAGVHQVHQRHGIQNENGIIGWRWPDQLRGLWRQPVKW
jgi:hypothetical protein